MVVDAVLLHASLAHSWKYYPEFLRRVRLFCDQWDSDVNVDALDEFLRLSFVSSKPTALMFVGLDEDGMVAGHFFAIAERYFGNPVVTIVQLEADERISPAVWNVCLNSLQMFAKAQGAKALQLAARNRAVARLFRRYGFEEQRVLMRQGVTVEGRAAIPTK